MHFQRNANDAFQKTMFREREGSRSVRGARAGPPAAVIVFESVELRVMTQFSQTCRNRDDTQELFSNPRHRELKTEQNIVAKVCVVCV